MAPKKARKEAKEERECKESNHNRREYARKIIGVSGKLRTLDNNFLL
jgi:hypothetical protein